MAQHEEHRNEKDTVVQSPSSSPPRKKFEKDLNDSKLEMLNLDDMEIVVEKELSVRFLLEQRIK